MESQSQNPEFRINPENFHPLIRTKVSFAGKKDSVTLNHLLSCFSQGNRKI